MLLPHLSVLLLPFLPFSSFPCLRNVFPDSLFTLCERSCLSVVTHFIFLPQDQRKKKKNRNNHWTLEVGERLRQALDNKMTELVKTQPSRRWPLQTIILFVIFNK